MLLTRKAPKTHEQFLLPAGSVTTCKNRMWIDLKSKQNIIISNIIRDF